jgi:pimeloyl-ACP methyl ester carboxylesterase
MRQFFLILLLSFSFISIFSQQNNTGHPPYPIIFVHGWSGDNSNWSDQISTDNDWISFFNQFNWSCDNGGQLDVCLEFTQGCLHDQSLDDVFDLTNSNVGAGDYYFINFDINKDGVENPHSWFEMNLYTEDIIEISNDDWSQDAIIKTGDLLLLFSNSLSMSEWEAVKVLSCDYDNHLFTVQRNFDGTYISDPDRFRLHSSLSNQASIIKQGIGLNLAINKVTQLNNTDKVILICHSMGGLAALQYVKSNSANPKVAKVITISTPHLGSDLSDISGLSFLAPQQLHSKETHSDAVRDLRYHTTSHLFSYEPNPPYPNSIDNSPSLFGGYENINSSINWFSNDYDSDGLESNNIYEGLLNGWNWPTNVELHCCLVNNWYISVSPPYIVMTGDDNVVRTDRQYPWPNIFPAPSIQFPMYMDTTLIRMFNTGVTNPTHTRSLREIQNVMRAFDEPDSKENAYNIRFENEDYLVVNGFTNRESNNLLTDVDWFCFNAHTS